MQELLAALGFQPVRLDEHTGELWYLSPFRSEKDESFAVTKSRRAWFDHGRGEGGGVIDFLCTYWNTDASGALRELSRLNIAATPDPAPSLGLPFKAGDAEPRLENFRTKKLHHPALRGYLASRGIPYALAMPYVEEAHYEVKGRPYFSLAFKNQRDGYELRNPYAKLCQSPKDITVFTCSGAGLGDRPVRVYEGFMDFLSDLVASDCKPESPLPFSVVVLNGAAMKDKGLAAVRALRPSDVSLYFDNDNTGRMLSAFFEAGLPDCRVFDRAQDYAPHDDVNAWLMHTRGQDRLR